MEAVRRVFKFGLGGAIGTGIGLVVGSLLAPQRGEDLQQATRNLIDEAKRAGEEAQARTEAELRQRFRQDVHDPAALTGVETRP
jgi:gas vesicle protein